MTTTDDIAIITDSADSLAQRLANPRRCSVCKQVKPLDQFALHRGLPSGHRHTCKDCTNARQRERRSTPEGKLENIMAWRKSTARALMRAGRYEDAERILPGCTETLIERGSSTGIDPSGQQNP